MLFISSQQDKKCHMSPLLLKSALLAISFALIAACSGSDNNYRTPDLIAPTLTLTPANNSTNLSVNPASA